MWATKAVEEPAAGHGTRTGIRSHAGQVVKDMAAPVPPQDHIDGLDAVCEGAVWRPETSIRSATPRLHPPIPGFLPFWGPPALGRLCELLSHGQLQKVRRREEGKAFPTLLQRRGDLRAGGQRLNSRYVPVSLPFRFLFWMSIYLSALIF